jgi:SMODS and SLOG-associating 2TM effector domain 1
MNEQDLQFLAIYEECRYKDQKNFYNRRLTEFQKARGQLITIQTLLIALAAIAAFLAASNFEWKILWTLLSIIFPILSTALTSYDGLYDFERHAKLYQDAQKALYLANEDSPNLRHGLSEEDRINLITPFVKEVERIFHKEQGQWGQLLSEVKQTEPPKHLHE